jgi:histone-binding protein RBBP4
LLIPGEGFINRKGNKVQAVEKINHNGEINRARYCPGNSNLFAVSSANGEIDLMTMKESVGKLIGHASEGYGLAWNPINHNILLSGQTDKKICIWDI